MADIGSYILPYIQKLPGFIDSQGIIIPEQAQNATDTIEFLKSYYPDLDISANADNKIVVEGTICNSPSELSDKLTSEAEKRAENEYFKDNDVYVGIITTGGVNDFSRALTFACSAKASVTELTGDSYAVVKCSSFQVKVVASDGTMPAKILVYYKYGGVNNWISVFDDESAASVSSGNVLYLKYMICKGSSGDCYVKGYYSSDATHPDKDNFEEEFADCNMGLFDYSWDSSTEKWVLSKTHYANLNHGGFSLIGMTNMIDESKELGAYSFGSSYDKKADVYAYVLWKKDGAPLIVHSDEIGRGIEIEVSGNNWSRIVTNANEQLVSMAPIFAPSSKNYVSAFSYWAMISSKDGVYELNAGGFGQNYRFDHGFVMNV